MTQKCFSKLFNLQTFCNFTKIVIATLVAVISTRRIAYAEEKKVVPTPNPKPNIIIIVSDDHGYAEIGAQGCKDIPTPNIDSIATSGVRFTNGYVSCPVCSPTRAGLLTGRYQQRFGHEFNSGEKGKPSMLPLTEATLADRLKKNGYVTGAVGKWHLGPIEKYRPLDRGFDEFFGFYGGSHDYMNYKIAPNSNNNMMKMDQPVIDEYATDVFAHETVAFINKHKSEQFFAYVCFNAVHSPLQSPEKYLERFKNIEDTNRRTFAAMLSAMDDGIGNILSTLKQLDLENNTLVFFLSDNGGPTESTTSKNDPLRGYKGQMYEGGIRVPFLAKWPARFPSGLVYNNPVISLDIHATVLAAVGNDIPDNLDGINLIPHITGEIKTPPHERLFWRMGPQKAVRVGNFKILTTVENSNWQLYNLAEDISEKTDLASTKPEVVKKLEKIYIEWDKQMAKPLWKGKTKFYPKENK